MNDSSIDLPGMETIDLTDKELPKESCAFIDYKLHHLVSSRPRKYKSYKVTSLFISFPSTSNPELN